MNNVNDDVKKLIINTLTNNIDYRLVCQIVDVISKDVQKKLDNQIIKNERVTDGIISLMSWFIDKDILCENYANISEGEFKEINDELIKVFSEKTGAPAKRLIYSMCDDCGHHNTYIVDSKNIKHITRIINYYSDLGEFEPDHVGDELFKSIMAYAKETFNLVDLDLDNIFEYYSEIRLEEWTISYFNSLISNNKISLVEFSNKLIGLIPSGRHSYSSHIWA